MQRITAKTETVNGENHSYSYAYDTIGQLTDVYRDGSLYGHYEYDSNGNRTSYSGTNGTASGVYDDQDRMTSYGGYTYQYTDNGELKSKTGSDGTVSYSYDVLGNLTEVDLVDGTKIAYVIDGANRRIGKKVNGTLTQGFLYQDGLNPVAELDGSGNVVSRFVYGTRVNVPDYMVKGGVTYRIIADHLGSVRLVVNTSIGDIVQKMEYDEFGRVIIDTNSGFQPFGFAGGVYDKDTGLVRFGVRDYDPDVGRWTCKDPIGFNGGDTDLYAYCVNEPINCVDPLGLVAIGFMASGTAEGGLDPIKKNMSGGVNAFGGAGIFLKWSGCNSTTLKSANIGGFYGWGGFYKTPKGSSTSTKCPPDSNTATGAFVGGGGNIFISNANSVKDFEGPFYNLNGNAGWGVAGGWQISLGTSNGKPIVVLSMGWLPGGGYGTSTSSYQTNTKTSNPWYPFK